MDRKILNIEKRHLVKLVSDYVSVKTIMLDKKFLLESYGVSNDDKKFLKNLNEPLSFIQSSEYSVAFDLTTLNDLKPKTIKILKSLYKSKRPSMYMFNFLESHGYHLNVSPLKMSLISMGKGTQVSNAGLTMMSGEYLQGQAYITDEEATLMKNEGVDYYFKLLTGKKPKKPKIEFEKPPIRFNEKLAERTQQKKLSIIKKDGIDYWFQKDEFYPKVIIEDNNDETSTLKVFYRTGKLKMEVFVSRLDSETRIVPKNGIGSILYDMQGNKIKESYYKRISFSKRFGGIYSDNTLSIKNMFEKLDSNYNGVIEHSYQKELLRLISTCSDLKPQSILNDIKRKYGIEYLDFKEDLDGFAEMLKLFIKT